MRRLSFALVATILVFAATVPVTAATITIINKDSAGVGLNDPIAAAPIGGNSGTTIGAQRLNVFKEAARIWGQILPSSVEIRVDASFTPLSCNTTSAVLGSAGPLEVFSGFPGALIPGTWYVGALADKLSGSDQDPSVSDIGAHFNSNLGSSGCLTGIYFYYGFDANHGSNISFLTVALHEFAHGLGFLTVANSSTGAFLSGTPDIFANYIFDNTAGKTWTEMTSDAERMASAVNAGKVAWSGTSATLAASKYLSKKPFLYVTAPLIVAGTLDVGTAAFGAVLTTAGVSGSLVAAIDPADGGGPSMFDACSALTNAATVAGKITLVDRGTCSFATKAKNAQNAGAIGAVIANNVAGAPPNMTGTDATITIPVVSVSQSDGANLRANLPASVRIALDPVALAGSDTAGRALLYTPSVFEPGSSVSHFDTSAVPNLLMEPAINADLPIGVDITAPLFRDIGWTVPPPGGDFNGDGKVDIAVYRPSTGTWWILRSSDGMAVAQQWGLSTDLPVPGDYDGDGKTDIAVFRPSSGTWWILRSSDGTAVAQQWGLSTDLPVPGDYDGDGKTDIAVFRPSTGTWWILRSSDGGVMARQWGLSTDIPVPGDYDGDGKTDIAVFRPSTGTWWILRSRDGAVMARQWGLSTDVPVPGDYDGDSKTDIAVYRPSTGTWWILKSSDGTAVAQQFGVSTDIPVAGDYDGDGKVDIAVYRPGTGIWWSLRSSDSTVTAAPWGLSTDRPVVGSPR